MQYASFTADRLVRSLPTKVKGYVIGATTASVVNIYDGTSTSGTIVFNVRIPANTTVSFSNEGVILSGGVFVDVVSGTGVQGTVFVE
jgi:hypothetical protein